MKASIIGVLKYLGVGLAAFFSPITYAFIFIGILVSVDTITGVMKAGKTDIREVKSNKAFRVIPKLIFYSLLVIVAHAVHIYVEPTVPFVKLSLVGIGFIEIKSIDENFRELYGFSFIDKVLEAGKKLKGIKKHTDE